jgi:hypothetical protein
MTAVLIHPPPFIHSTRSEIPPVDLWFIYLFLFLFRSPSSVSLVFISLSTARLDGISAGRNCGGSTSHEGATGQRSAAVPAGGAKLGRSGGTAKVPRLTDGRRLPDPLYTGIEVEKRWRLKNASRSIVDSPVALRLSRPTQLVGQRGGNSCINARCPARRRFCWSLIIELIKIKYPEIEFLLRLNYSGNGQLFWFQFPHKIKWNQSKDAPV